MFSFKAFALSGNQKPEGYDAAVYYTPEASIQNAQLIVSQVGEDTNWKMCVDTFVNAHTQAKVDINTWGCVVSLCLCFYIYYTTTINCICPKLKKITLSQQLSYITQITTTTIIIMIIIIIIIIIKIIMITV